MMGTVPETPNTGADGTATPNPVLSELHMQFELAKLQESKVNVEMKLKCARLERVKIEAQLQHSVPEVTSNANFYVSLHIKLVHPFCE